MATPVTGARRTEGPTSPSGTGARRTAGPTSSSGTARETEGRRARLRPPALPVRPSRRARPSSPTALARWGRRPVDRHAVRPAARRGRARRSRRRTASGATRRASARPSCGRRCGAGWTGGSASTCRIAQIAACVGTKELVGTLPQWLRLRSPDRDTVLYPAIAYPTYEMGAILAGCRAGRGADRRPVPLDLDAIDAGRRRPRACASGSTAPATRPARSTTSARRRRGAGPRGAGLQRRVLRASSPGTDRRARSSSTGSTAWSRSTRSRSARTWPACGSASTPATPSWSRYLQEVRKHVGMLVPGPGAGRRGGRPRRRRRTSRCSGERYRRRLELMAGALSKWAGRRHRPAVRRLLPVVRRRRRLGLHRAPGARRRARW